MFFNLRALSVSIALTGIAASSYFLFNKKCSPFRTNYFYKSSLNTSESILECSGGGKNYSVFLEFEENSSHPGSQNNLSFKVVDNNEKKIKWGPGVDSRNKWTDWGVSITVTDKNNVDGSQETKIRVPNRGNVWQSWSTVQIPCQKSQLKWKAPEKECEKCCTGGFFKAAKTKFKLDSEVIAIESKSNNFSWKDSFNPKQIFCPY